MWIHKVIGALPSAPRRALLRAGHAVGSNVFRLPNPFRDFARLAAIMPPVAVLDVGAHSGETVRELRKILPQVPVHAFEPTPATCARLRAATVAWPEVAVHEVALTDRVGNAQFFLNANSETNSLLDNDEGNRREVGAATRHVGTVEVPLTTLDDWATDHVPSGPLFIKADVQGAELKLVAGGKKVMAERVMAFYSEVSIAPLYASQADLGSLHGYLTKELPFTLFQIYRTRSNGVGRALWTDALWVHRDLMERL